MKPWTKWKGNLWNETIFENHISDKQLISKLYKELLQLSRLKKASNPIKNGQRKWIDISEDMNGQKIHEKMLNVTNIVEL